MSLGKSAARAFLSAIVSIASVSAGAGPVVSDAIRISITPRGQDYFTTELGRVLLENGLDLSKTHWDRIALTTGHGIDDLPSGLARAFYGFPIHAPKIEVSLHGADLRVKFRSLGAVVDPAGPAAYGYPKSKGIVVLLRLEAEGLGFDVRALRLKDLANPDLLGTTGVDGFAASLVDGPTHPVKAQVPILVDADGRRATMKILAMRSNLETALFESTFANVATPELKLVVNGKEYAFDRAAFETDLRACLPELTAKIAERVRTYFEGEGRGTIQAQFDALAAEMSYSFTVPFSKDPARKKEESVAVGLLPKRVEYAATERLDLVYDVEIRDERPWVPALDAVPTWGEPGASDDTYDLSVAIRPAAANALLERAWRRGLLKDIAMGNDDSGHPTKVRISAPPILTLPGAPEAGLANVHAKIGFYVRGIGKLLFKGPIPIDLDLVLRAASAGNRAEVSLDHIDETTLKVDTRATWLRPIRGLVESLVKKKVAELNRNAREKSTPLAAFAIPETLVGVPVRLDRLRTDAGNLILYGDILRN